MVCVYEFGVKNICYICLCTRWWGCFGEEDKKGSKSNVGGDDDDDDCMTKRKRK